MRAWCLTRARYPSSLFSPIFHRTHTQSIRRTGMATVYLAEDLKHHSHTAAA